MQPLSANHYNTKVDKHKSGSGSKEEEEPRAQLDFLHLDGEAAGDRGPGLRGEGRLRRSAGEAPLSATSSSAERCWGHPLLMVLRRGWSENRHARHRMRTLLVATLIMAGHTKSQRGFKTVPKPSYRTRVKPRLPARSAPSGLTVSGLLTGLCAPRLSALTGGTESRPGWIMDKQQFDFLCHSQARISNDTLELILRFLRIEIFLKWKKL